MVFFFNEQQPYIDRVSGEILAAKIKAYMKNEDWVTWTGSSWTEYADWVIVNRLARIWIILNWLRDWVLLNCSADWFLLNGLRGLNWHATDTHIGSSWTEYAWLKFRLSFIAAAKSVHHLLRRLTELLRRNSQKLPNTVPCTKASIASLTAELRQSWLIDYNERRLLTAETDFG